jgi:hypothetical protein
MHIPHPIHILANELPNQEGYTGQGRGTVRFGAPLKLMLSLYFGFVQIIVVVRFGVTEGGKILSCP